MRGTATANGTETIVITTRDGKQLKAFDARTAWHATVTRVAALDVWTARRRRSDLQARVLDVSSPADTRP